jgi:hypothetical protein
MKLKIKVFLQIMVVIISFITCSVSAYADAVIQIGDDYTINVTGDNIAAWITPHDKNVLLGAEAVWSGMDDTNRDGYEMIDGDHTTGWNGTADGSTWLQADIGAVYRIHTLILYNSRTEAAASHINSFAVQISTDGKIWADAWINAEPSESLPDIMVYELKTPALARYVKLVISGEGAITNSFYELEAWGVAEPVANTAATALNGADRVNAGTPFSLTYGLSAVHNITAQDIIINYNDNLFQFIQAVSVKDGTVIQDSLVSTTQASLRFIIASTGKDNDINGTEDVLRLDFLARLPGTGSISVMNASLSDGQGKIINAAGISKTVEVVDKAQLTEALAAARHKHDTAVAGADPGQYPADAITALQASIDAANAIYNNPAATPSMVSKAVLDLNTAVAVFNAAKILDADKTILKSKILEAQAVLNSAAEGLSAGQYPAGTKDKLSLAINSAISVRDNIATSAQTVRAVTDLDTAVSVFHKLIITDRTGDINKIPGYDIGDLGMIASHYGMSETDQGWNEIKQADINGDGKIGLYEMAFTARKIIGD